MKIFLLGKNGLALLVARTTRVSISSACPMCSANGASPTTTRLDVEGMKALLLKLDFMQCIARGEPVVVEE